MKTPDSFDVASLIAARVKGTITPEEDKILEQWLAQSRENHRFYSEATNPQHIRTRLEEYGGADLSRIGTKVILHARAQGRRSRILRRMRGVAAVFLVLLAVGGILLLFRNENSGRTEDILPGRQYAILETSGGQRHELGKDIIPVLLSDGGVNINVDSAGVAYSVADGGGEMRWDRLTIPRGAEFMVTLSDGSRVWLNSDTELRYPAAFLGDKREIFLRGEAYFEVEPSDVEFVVHASGAQVRVLGTSFNVMAYADESVIQTTLVNGKVEITSEAETVTLLPGQQAVMSGGRGITVNAVDVGSYTGWKDKMFIFDNENLGSIMRKLSRWYDVEIEIESPELENSVFYGVMRKYESISKMLDMISRTSPIEYHITREKIIIRTAKR